MMTLTFTTPTRSAHARPPTRTQPRTNRTHVITLAKGGKGASEPEPEVDPEAIEMDAMERMDKTMDSIAKDFSTVRT